MTPSWIKTRKAPALIGLTALFWALFTVCRPALLPLRVTIGADAPSQGAIIEWDSGDGFNKLEMIGPVQPGRSVMLPQYEIGRMRVSPSPLAPSPFSVRIESCEGQNCAEQAFAPLDQDAGSATSAIYNAPRHFRSPRLVVLQLVAAILAALLVFRISGEIGRAADGANGKFHDSAGTAERSSRRFLLCSFAFASICFLTWTAAHWPASMTFISYISWEKTKTLQFDYFTPWLYQYNLVILAQIFDSPAVAAVSQAIALALLVSLILSWLVLRGLHKAVAGLFLVMFSISPQIGAWSTMIWHDVPYSILVVAAAAFMARLFFERRYENTAYIPDNGRLAWLTIGFVHLVLLRRNGIIFLPIIPSILYLLDITDRSTLRKFSLCSIVLYSLLEFGGTAALDVDKATERRIPVAFLTDLQWKLNPLAALFVNKEGFVSDNPARDRDIISKLMPLEEIPKWYSPSSIESVFWRLNRKVTPEELAAVNRMYYRLLLPNLPIIAADRAYVFFKGLGNFFYFNNLETLPNKGILNFPAAWNLRSRPISANLHEWMKWYTDCFAGNAWGRITILSPLWGMLLCLLALIFYAWVPITALYSFLILIQVPFLFVTLPAAETRYFFFAYLGGFFVIPMLLMEIRAIRRQSGRIPAD